MERAAPIFEAENSGAFLDSCVIHCQSLKDESWNDYKIDMPDGFTYSANDAFARWYYNEGCTCKNILFISLCYFGVVIFIDSCYVIVPL